MAGSRWSSRARWISTALTALGLAGTVLLLPSDANAAFPGADGRIVFTAWPNDSSWKELYTILPDGSGIQQLTDTRATKQYPSWSSDGELLLYASEPPSELHRPNRPVRLMTMTGDGEVERIATHRPTPNGWFHAPSFSPNGKRIVYSTGSKLRVLRADGSSDRVLFDGGRGERRSASRFCSSRGVPAPTGRSGCLVTPRYSPNGRRIVFARGPAGKPWTGIWTIRSNGSGLRRLTNPHDDVYEITPDYSPDGRRIVFERMFAGPGGNRLILMGGDGSNERAIPGHNQFGRQPTYPVFSPTGSRIAGRLHQSVGCCRPENCFELFTISPAGNDANDLTDFCSNFRRYLYVEGQISWQPLP